MRTAELRAACEKPRARNYSKIGVATKRAALAALTPTALMETAFSVPPKAGEPMAETRPARAAGEERNGVKRPLGASSKDVREAAEKVDWNPNNVSIEPSTSWPQSKTFPTCDTSSRIAAACTNRMHGTSRGDYLTLSPMLGGVARGFPACD